MDFELGRTKKDQVADEMRRRIASGAWQVGQSVGDLFRLAEEFGVSWGTVRAAQEILVREGLLSQIRAGMPTRVIATPTASDAADRLLAKLRTAYRDLGEVIADLEGAA